MFFSIKENEPFYGKVSSPSHGTCYLTLEKVKNPKVTKGKIGLSQLQVQYACSKFIIHAL